MNGSPPWQPQSSYEAYFWEVVSDWLPEYLSLLSPLRCQPEDTPEPLSRSKERLDPSGYSLHRELVERKVTQRESSYFKYTIS